MKSIFNVIFNNKKTTTTPTSYQALMYGQHEPEWSNRNYSDFATHAYARNVIANRCINIIAQGAASVPWQLFKQKRSLVEVKNHPLLKLLKQPNPLLGGAEFFEKLFAYKLLSGNSYILMIGTDQPKELHLLRPDRVTIVEGDANIPQGYIYNVLAQGEVKKAFYPIDMVTGRSQVLHIKNFHPLDDYYGLSPIEAASYSIDQHNQAAKWNQALLQNGARPSGALVVKASNENMSANLSQEQFDRLKEQIDSNFSGSANAGRPLLLEGGLDWKEMSMSPRDMDFISTKDSSARDIALSFGVPPQLLGIPGDNTYSNLQEARIALWEETIIPMLDHLCDALNSWLVPSFGEEYHLSYHKDEISVLSGKRESAWKRVNECEFMTINEKRFAFGLEPIKDGNSFSKSHLTK